MSVLLSKHAGQCFGVRRAIAMAEQALQDGPWPVQTLGDLVHNPQEVERLRSLGLIPRKDLSEVDGGTVIIRAHGAPPGLIEAIEERGCRAVNATCPCVARVADLVARRRQEGRPVLLVGACDHPEVRAIAAWAGGCRVIETPEDVASLPPAPSATVVAQTTTSRSLWERILSLLAQRIPDLEQIDTICEATAKRQEEAVQLAGRCDVMLVIGGAHSANTQHLAASARQHCPRTYLIESVRDLTPDMYAHASAIGISAGASTPDWIIKEVVTHMNDIDQTDSMATEAVPAAQEAMKATPAADHASESFMEAFEKTLVSIKPGHSVKGTIVQITDDEICVNIGYKSDAVVPKAELTDDLADLSIGSEIEVEVVKVNDGEGNVLCSQRSIAVRRNWDELIGCFERGEPVDGVGKEVVKGGLIANVKGIRTFIPASQLSERYVEKIEQFIGQPMRLKIIEADKPKRRLVASRKQVLQQEAEARKSSAWGKLEIGSIVKGTVRRLTDFGAFVDVGGVDGLIHVTDLSWGRVKHPSDVVRIGDELDVQVLSLDREKERIGLGLKQTHPRPWDIAPQNYPVGSIFSGKVVRIVTFGAFIELEPGLDGLVHISQIAQDRINRVEDALEVGQIVNVKVLEVDADKKRISLSIRQAYEELGEMGFAAEAHEEAADMAEAAAADAVEDETAVEETAAEEEVPAAE